MEPAEAVLQFLRSVGPRAEAEFYLRLFRSQPREAFAALAVDASTMRQNADAVALDLRLLCHLDLTPAVIVGLWDPQAARAQADSLLRRLDAMQIAYAGPFSTTKTSAIAQAAQAGRIPLVMPAEARLDARMANLGELLEQLATRKLIFLREAGGVRRDGERISVVNVTTEAARLVADASLGEADRELIALSQRLLRQRESRHLLIAMTSPLNLLHELFTVRGAGTLLRRGAQVSRHEGLSGVDPDRLLETLEASFERPVRRELLQRHFTHCYVADDYRGVALLAPCPFGGYLDKFAVTAVARGEGLGRDLWEAVIADYPKLLWRARPQNPVAGWYEQQCEARWHRGPWTVYMRGIEPDQAAEAIAFASERPPDL